MKRVVVFLSLVSCGFGYQSLRVPANASINLTVPATAPFTALGDYRVAFRLHDWSLPASGQVTLFHIGNGSVTLNSSGQLCGLNFGDNQSSWGNNVCVSVGGLNDIVGRIQRFGTSFPVHDPLPGSNWLEVQDLGTGKILPYIGCSWANTGCPLDVAQPASVAGTTAAIGSSVTFSLAWLKWFSSTVPPGSVLENESTPADLADWRFEGNYSNQGTGGYGVKLSGNSSFVESPVKPPACNLTRQIFRAGNSGQLNNYAYPLDGSAGLQYQWQQLSGPTQLIWSAQNTGQPALSGGVFGSYVLQLAVTDGSGQSSTCSIKDGFVATDDNGVVVTGNPSVDILLGPQIQLGRNPWGWFDDRHTAEAALQIADLSTYYSLGGTAPWNTAAPGTITVKSNSPIVNGAGTSFTTTFCQGPANPTVPKAGGAFISIWYPLPAVQEGSGRRFMVVASCQSDTQLTLSRAWNDMGFVTDGSGWNYASIDVSVFNMWRASIAPADFYDVVAALYALYYRSGIDDYRNAARLLADNFWQFILDSGRNYFYGEGYNTFEHNRSVLGMCLRALDGRPDMWSGLELIANFNISIYQAHFNNYGNWTEIGGGPGGGDPREDGYALAEEAYCALFDPNAAAAAACRAGISTVMTRGWAAARFPDGNWYSLYWGGMGGGPQSVKYAGFTAGTSASLTNGSPVVTCVSGTGSCNWTADLFTDGNGHANPWWFTNSTTNAPGSNADGDPVVYYPVFVDASHLRLQDISGNAIGYQGTTGNHGWIAGLSSLAVGFGVQPYMLGILGTAFDFTAKAMACTAPGVPANCSDAIAANAKTFNVQVGNYLRSYGYWPSTKGMYYMAGFPNCTPPVADTNYGCTAGNTAGQARTLNAEALRGVMTAYTNSLDPNLLSFGDMLYTAMWGRPGFSLPNGQTSDGMYNSGYDDGFGGYMTGNPPVGSAHKYFGMGWGIGAGSAWPAARLGGPHIGRQVHSSVTVDIGSVANAKAFNLVVTHPTGATTTIHCTASPCSLGFDQATGTPVVQIQYLAADGTVLSTAPYRGPLRIAKSLTLAPKTVVAITIPDAPPFTTLSQTRVEFRLHGWSTPAQTSTILALGGPSATAPMFSVQLTSGNELCAVDWVDTMGSFGNRMCADIAGLLDLVARFQRDTTGRSFLFEVRTVDNLPLTTYCGSQPSGFENTSACPILTANSTSFAGVAKIGHASSTGGIGFAWIKWFSTVVAAGSGSIQEATPADLADWRFDGTTTEFATGRAAIIPGGADFGPEPLYPLNPGRPLR